MRLLPVQASIVNPVIFVVCKIVITTATFVTGCVNAGGTTITYSYDPLSVDTSEAFNTVLIVPIRAMKELIGSDVVKVNCMTWYPWGKKIVAWIDVPFGSVIGFVGDIWRPFVKYIDPEDTDDINGESSENTW